MKTLKQLIEQEQRGNAEQDNKVRCFAINNFGKGAHPYADADTIGGFKAPYVRQCLLKMAGSTRVKSEFRERAKELAK